jgi:Transglycosylase SLT domain
VVTFAQLRDVNPAMFDQSAGAWKQWADSAMEHAGYLNDKVGQHITEGHWGGLASALARGRVNDAHVNVSSSAGQLYNVETMLTQAGKDFEAAQNDLLGAVKEAQGAGFTVSDDGQITVPASLTTGKSDADVKAINDHAQTLQTRITAAVYRATRVDNGLTQALAGLDPKTGASGPNGSHGPSGWNGDYGSSGAPPLTQPSGAVADWIKQAIDIMRANGVNVSYADAAIIATIIQYESGGNPNAINLWDSNAAAGHPSKGLMQTIDPTFNSYALPGHTSIYNPVDNIIAGTRYALSRYGSLNNVPGIQGIAHHSGYVGY